jgi:phenylacetate-CoA ligase
MLIIRGVNIFPSQIEELLLRTSGLSAHYQLELTRQGYLDALEVHVECSVQAAAMADVRDRAARALAQDIKNNIGVSVSVRIHEPGSMERSAGKAKRVVDRRTP